MSKQRLTKSLVSSCRRGHSPCLPAHTLLPFLYETTTIRTLSTLRSHGFPTYESTHTSGDGSRGTLPQSDHIPFDNVQKKDRRGGAEKDTSSLSATEREAFTKLFHQLGSSQANAAEGRLRSKYKSKEGYKQRKHAIAEMSSEQRSETLARLPASIRSLAQTALEKTGNSVEEPTRPTQYLTSEKEGDESAGELEGPSDAALEAHIERLDTLFHEQQTDLALWRILHHELFDPLMHLNLDGKQQSKRALRGAKDTPIKGTASTTISSTANPELVLASAPLVTLLAVEHLQERFPGSSVPLSILPQLKRISTTAHALALSPDLYASLLLIDWSRSNSPASTISILQEIDMEGIEFERTVLASLAHIITEGSTMRSGAHGEAVKLLCSMEGWEDKLAELRGVWAPRVKQRIVDAAVREAHAREEAEQQQQQAAAAAAQDAVGIASADEADGTTSSSGVGGLDRFSG